jgi:hypothetical protein
VGNLQVRVTCDYTGEEFTIVVLYNLDTRLWPFMGRDGVEMAIVTACVVERNELFYKFDEMNLCKETHPRSYVRWLCKKALEVNPYLKETLRQWENSGRNPKNYSPHSPKISRPPLVQ